MKHLHEILNILQVKQVSSRFLQGGGTSDMNLSVVKLYVIFS